jgi:tetratricopeptide (TPR) repeat protein
MAPVLPEPLKRAFAAYQTGDLAGAEGLCRDILAKHNRNDAVYFDAIHLLAVVQSRSGRLAEALASYDEALAIRPRFPDALNNRANIFKALKRFDEALAGYDSALAVRPDFVEALSNRGKALMEMSRFEDALASYDRALASRPDHVMALNNRGRALNELKRFDEAVISYDKALAIKPDFVEALNNRGIALEGLQRLEKAFANRKQSLALALVLGEAEALSTQGVIRHEPVLVEDAVANADEAVATQRDGAEAPLPGNAEALSTEGVILREPGLVEDAVASSDKALAAQLDGAEALYHRARALTELGRFEDALASCKAALASRPDFAEALNQRGVIQKELRCLPEALASFGKAQELRPDFVDAHRNEVELHLLVGDYRRAWWKWDQQAKRGAPAPLRSEFSNPPWDGLELLCDKTILLHGDRAYGDTIQFSRYIPLLAARGARVIVEVERPLRKLVAGIAGVAQVVADDSAPAPFDLHCPFAGLPRAFGTTLNNIPAKVPYLRASKQAVAEWDTRLGAKTRRRIGIVWSGDPPRENNLSCSIELVALVKLLDVDATFVCAQRDISAADEALLQERPEILTFNNALSDFSEAAALVSCLDLVISVDSCMAHLAGALGKPVWVLLPYTPDWGWFIDREDSPWYPTARLFRQRRYDDWSQVVARVSVELQRFVGPSGATVRLASDTAFQLGGD